MSDYGSNSEHWRTYIAVIDTSFDDVTKDGIRDRNSTTVGTESTLFNLAVSLCLHLVKVALPFLVFELCHRADCLTLETIDREKALGCSLDTPMSRDESHVAWRNRIAFK